MKKIKIEWCDLRKMYLVMAGGLPFSQVYSDTNYENCSIIRAAYERVGYERVA